ncbi:MAG TPA: alkaline phosphatase family protein [Candidatus Krumholzibacteria bacterium]|nr:alkaline phosphatase family protein [Candidatus Krumholzibacteria bacterium]
MNTARHGWDRRVRALVAIACCAVALVCSCATPEQPAPAVTRVAHTSAPPDVRVVIVVIDGPRYSETFGDPLHTHVPQLWNVLAPQGTICSNFRNLGVTTTNPGHGTLLSGIWQFIDDEGVTRIPSPTLFEYYRKAWGVPASDALLVTGKIKLGAVAYSTSAAYGASFGATTDLDTPHDIDTYDHLIQHLDAESPHLVMCSFSDVDQAGHSGVWSDYLHSINVVDSLVNLTWNHLQSSPDYAGRTYMFVTADHGRHDDAHGGFKEHGDGCDGCRHTIFLALGPGIRAGQAIDTAYSQQNLCNTVGRLMNLPTTESPGIIMTDLFDALPTGVLH